MIGRLFGSRYRVIDRLGEGGMGTVYLCEHAVLGRRFAVKVLRPDRAADPELKERFRTEAIAASGIGQENVVDVLDYGEEPDGSLFYAMEALEGRSLGAVLREEGPLAVGRALALLEQICRALGAAHARSVVHRDVKPENIFVVRGRDRAERVKIIDFGISHMAESPQRDRITRAGAIIGTPEYMAPEQATGNAVDHRSDVYAVGVLAFEILTGALPLLGETPIATIVAHQTKAPEPPSRRQPGIPPEVDALVLRALAKRAEDRFESMFAMAAEIARIRLTSCLACDPARASSPRPPTARYEAPLRPSGRGETVPLPESSPGWRFTPPVTAAPPRPRRAGAALALVGAGAAGAIALFAAGWWLHRPASEAAPAAPAVTLAAAAPAPPARPAQRPAPAEAVAPAPAAGQERLAPDAATVAPRLVTEPPPAAARSVHRRVRIAAPAPRPDPDVKDPYGDEADLKPDPFR